MRVARQHSSLTALVGWLIAIVLLLPMVLVVLPSPVSAQEAALLHDLRKALCSEQGQPTQHDQFDCDHCVLSAPLHLPRLQASPDPFAIFAPLAQGEKVAFVFESLSRAALARMTIPDPGRGPPA